MKVLEDLINCLTRLPGIGRKSAQRVAYHLLKAEVNFSENLAQLILKVKTQIKFCSVCGSWTEQEICDICSSLQRDSSIICVVEQPQDVMTIENTREYHGYYHVLGGLISPLDGVSPDDIAISALERRVEKGAIKEIVIATNPTVEGDTTALYIRRIFEPKGLSITRPATGIPVGGDLEYADRLTLARSIRGRVKI